MSVELQALSGRRESVSTADTIALDTPLLILSKSKRQEEREFYLRMATSQKWSSRELEQPDQEFDGKIRSTQTKWCGGALLRS
jgi:hypothetical protein